MMHPCRPNLLTAPCLPGSGATGLAAIATPGHTLAAFFGRQRPFGIPGPLDRRIAGLALAGVGGIFLGLLWNKGFPINKNLWTSSYVLLSGGAASLGQAATMALVEQAGLTRSAWPFLPFGVNPILAYVGSEAMAVLVYEVILVPDADGPVTLEAWIYRHGFLSWLSPMNASLGFALLFVAVWWAILVVLRRRGIILKI